MNLWRMLDEEAAALARYVQQGIVQVRSGRRGAGTGIIVQPNGRIVTNAHVVRQRYPMVALPDGHTLRAQLVAHDPALDLALLEVEAAALPALPLAPPGNARPGDFVLAVGHPWGVIGSATAGIIVGAQQVHVPEPLSGREWIFADLHLRPGNSGGPLVDAQGQVVGVGTLAIGPNRGAAIPAPVIAGFIAQAAAQAQFFRAGKVFES